MKPIPPMLKSSKCNLTSCPPPPPAARESGGGGCLTAALTQWSDRVRFVFGGFGKSGTVSSGFRQKGKARRSRTAEHDNQLYFMSLYSNLLHPPAGTHRPTLKTDHRGEGTHFPPVSKVKLAQTEAEGDFFSMCCCCWGRWKKWTRSAGNTGSRKVRVEPMKCDGLI